MAVHCNDFEALTQAYLDEELAEHELTDFESHRSNCSDCRALLAAETAFREILRRRLAPPAAPGHLISSIQGILDNEDNLRATANRGKRWSWVLPSTASVAAAAAVILFTVNLVTNHRAPERVASVNVNQANPMRPLMRATPVDVRPQSSLSLSPRERAIRVQSHVYVGNQPFTVSVDMVDVKTLRLADQTRTVSNGLILWSRSRGQISEVTYVNRNGRFGYVLRSAMPEKDLVTVAKALFR